MNKFFAQAFGSSEELSSEMKELLALIYADCRSLDAKIAHLDRKLSQTAKNHPVGKRIMTIPGIGPICATAVLAAVGSDSHFKNGRQFASWLGLTPREYSSGGKQRQFGISKRGNSYLRKLLVHGARSVVYYAAAKQDPKSAWLNELKKRAGTKKATVACANKIARIVWAIIRSEQEYNPSCV